MDGVYNDVAVCTIIVFHGCETWSLTLREEHWLRVLRKMFGPKRHEVTGEWSRLHKQGA